MYSKVIITIALLAITAAAQNVKSTCTVSPAGCTIGPTACPTGCIKSARCSKPCAAQKTVSATYTSISTVTAPAITVTALRTSTVTVQRVSTSTTQRVSTVTRTVTATPTPSPQPACQKQLPYVELFAFDTARCELPAGLLGLLDPPTFGGVPNQLNTGAYDEVEPGYLQFQTSCTVLNTADSMSAYFTVDGTDGTNITQAVCHVLLYGSDDCTGGPDVLLFSRNNTCLTNNDEPWNSARYECGTPVGSNQ